MSEAEEDKLIPFSGRSPKDLAYLCITEVNNFLMSLGEEGAQLQMDPDLTSSFFEPTMKLLVEGHPASLFQGIMLKTQLGLADRVREAERHGDYDDEATTMIGIIGNIATLIRKNPEHVKKWGALDLVNFL